MFVVTGFRILAKEVFDGKVQVANFLGLLKS